MADTRFTLPPEYLKAVASLNLSVPTFSWTTGALAPVVQAVAPEPARVVQSQFRLPWYNLEEALEAANRLQTQRGYSTWPTLERVLAAWDWRTHTDDQGSLDGLYGGRTPESQLSILQAIAPFVEPGSFLEFAGGTEKSWRWVFRAGKLETIKPVTSWPM